MKLPFLLFVGALLLSVSANAQDPKAAASDAALQQIAFVHGGTGPFAVAGYRMGERALKELNLSRGDFALEVVHKTPHEVQFSCIADGAQAATGVSVGKLNLKLIEAPAKDVVTLIRDKKSGKTITFKLKPEFLQKYLNLPHENLPAAGKEVLTLPDDHIFSIE